MTASIQQEVNQIVEIKSRATRLDNLIQGYRLCARTEGKSEKTIRIYTTALTTLKGFLEARQYPVDVTEIGASELREFILHLQQVKAFEHHPFTKPQDKGLSGHAVNCYLRAIRAFWSWLMREEIIMSSPFSRVKIPKPPKKVIATFSEKQLSAILRAVNTATPAGFREQVNDHQGDINWTKKKIILVK
jgi:site-specific recombinase XerD